jgi:hypothetical protein
VFQITEPYFDNLAVGTYTGKVIDKNGCEAVLNTRILSNTVPLTATATTTDATSSTNGSITVTAKGCTAPYKYSIDGTNFQDSNVFENIVAGNYTITAKESMGNIATVQATVAQAPPLSLTATSTNVTFITNNGSISQTGSGGKPPYQYSMNGTTFQSTDTFEALAVGKYTFYVKDAKGDRGTIGVEVKGSIEAVEITIPALANARTTSIYDLGQVIVEWDAEKRTFQFITGIKGTYNKGILSIDAPENLKGEYRALINKNDRTQFLGFYKKDYTTPCTSSGITSGTGTSCKMLCEEGFLPSEIYDNSVKIPFSIHLQAFAPFETFGFGFEGDGNDRKIGNGRALDYRMYTFCDFQYAGNSFVYKGHSEPPTFSDWFGVNRQQSETQAVIDFYSSSIPQQAHLQIIAQAGNDATMAQFVNDYWEQNYNTDIGNLSDMNIDRDLTSTLEMIDIDENNKILKISGEMKGEMFPTTDLFIRDKNGTEITLGGSPATVPMGNFPCNFCNCEAKNCGPFAQLGKPIFKNFDFNISIKIEDGLFKKVINSAGQEIEISNWNQIWLNSNTVNIIPK